MKHIHHIIPKHFGGSDHSDNLIELSVEEHAEAHRILYEKYGKWEDRLAWLGLAGLISKKELIRQILVESGKKGAAKTNLNKSIKRGPKPGEFVPVGTKGKKWYHNPLNPLEKICISDDVVPPTGWIKGQGKKAVNPGMNFHSKRIKKDFL